MLAFERAIESLLNKLNIPGCSVAIIKQQKVVFAKGFGFANIENQIPATENTPYHIASLTKPFSAAVLMKLVEQKKLDLDNEMSEILRETPIPFQGVTIKGYAHLCAKIKEIGQDSAIPFAFLFRDYKCDTEKIRVRHHLTHTAQGAPGEKYNYNGFLFGLLSWVAEEVSGNSFERLLVENIITPLNMIKTIPSFKDNNRDAVIADLATYYRANGDGSFDASEWPSKDIIKAFEDKGMKIMDRLNASSGIISTVIDLSKFDIAMDQNLIVSEKTKKAMFTQTTSTKGGILPYGLGWFVQEHEKEKIVWHYGHAPQAYSSLWLKIPRKNISMILLANSEGVSGPFDLGAGDILKCPFAVMFLSLLKTRL